MPAIDDSKSLTVKSRKGRGHCTSRCTETPHNALGQPVETSVCRFFPEGPVRTPAQSCGSQNRDAHELRRTTVTVATDVQPRSACAAAQLYVSGQPPATPSLTRTTPNALKVMEASQCTFRSTLSQHRDPNWFRPPCFIFVHADRERTGRERSQTSLLSGCSVILFAPYSCLRMWRRCPNQAFSSAFMLLPLAIFSRRASSLALASLSLP